jgi:hypothetical protein
LITIYLDEDASWRRVLTEWRAAGGSMWATGELGRMETPDEEQLAFAHERGWVLLSCNVEHFTRLHTLWSRDGRSHSGIIVLSQQRLDQTLIVRALELLTQSVPDDQWLNRLEYLMDWVRRLPD